MNDPILLPPLRVEDILAEISQLPSLPAIVGEMAEALRDEDADLDRLAASIARDQAIAARTLRVANSPFFGLQQRVGTIRDALVVLGLRAVGSLVTAASVTGFFKPMSESGFDLPGFWRHGIGVALAGRALAARVGLGGEAGFTAGLLHEIGRLLLATARPRHYAQVLAWRAATDASLDAAERHVLGIGHAMAGEALARRWHFPEEICLAVARHHAPPDGERASLVDVTHVADALAHALDLAGDPLAQVPPVERAAWIRLGLDGVDIAPLLASIELEHESYRALLAA